MSYSQHSNLITSGDYQPMFNKDYMSYEKVVEDYGVRYTLSMNPRHLAMYEITGYSKERGYTGNLPVQDRVLRRFYIGDPTKNSIEKLHPPRVYTYTEAYKNDWQVNNLNIPKHIKAWLKINKGGFFSITAFDVYERKLLQPQVMLNYGNIGQGAGKRPSSEQGGATKSVLNNSADSPLYLTYDMSRKLFSVEFVDYMSVTQFKNGDIYFNFNVVGYGYNQEKQTLFKHTNDRYILKIREKEGRTGMFKNGKLLTANFGIYRAFELGFCDSWVNFRLDKDPTAEDNIFCRLFRKHFVRMSASRYEQTSSNLTVVDIASELLMLYRVRRNRQLADLPWDSLDLCHLYNFYEMEAEDYKQKVLARNNINRYLRKGNTKRATEFGYYGFKFPKSVKKLLLKIPPFSISYYNIECLHKIYKKYDTNLTLSIMKNEAGEIDEHFLKNISFLHAVLLGFKKKQVVADRARTVDTIRMRSELEGMGVNVNYTTNNFAEYHDYLSKLYTAMISKHSGAQSMAYKAVDTSKQLPSMAVNGYTVRSPMTTSELVDVGSDMRHCVASYCRGYFYRELEILLIEKEGVYIACIEIIKNKICQAKLKRNDPIYNNDEVFEVLKTWAAEHDYEFNTHDCYPGQKHFTYPEQPKSCDKRKAIVSRKRYFISVCGLWYDVAQEEAIKFQLTPVWQRVADDNCTMNQDPKPWLEMFDNHTRHTRSDNFPPF